LANLAAGQGTLTAKSKANILRDSHGIEKGGALKQHAKFATDAQQFTFAHADNILAFDQYPASVRLKQSDQMFEQHAFAATAPADDDHRFTFLDAEAHILQDRVRAEVLGQIANLDHNVLSRRPRVRVRKKLEIRMAIEEYTTASVVARPTPSAPSPQ